MRNLLFYIPIKVKLALAISGIIALVTVFILIFYPYIQQERATEFLRAEAISIASMLAYVVGPALEFDDVQSMRESYRFIAANRGLEYVLIYNSHGDPVASFNPDRGKNIKIDPGGVLNQGSSLFADGLLHVAVPIYEVEGNKRIGSLHLGISLRDLETISDNNRRVTLIVCLFILLFGIMVAIYLGGKFADPILTLRKAALEVAGGNVHVMVDVPTKDELEELGNSFNQMVANIRGSMQEIKSRQQEAESDRKATEEANRKLDAQIAYLATLNRISNRFKVTTTKDQLLHMVPEIVCEMLHYDRAFFLLKEGETLKLTNAVFKREFYIDKKMISNLIGSVVGSDAVEFAALRKGLPSVVDRLEILNGKINGPYPSHETFVLVPVHGKTEAWGILIAGYCEPLTSSRVMEDELEKLTLFANNLRLSLDNVSLLEDLERRVETRTQELERVNAKLNKEIAEKEDFLRAVSHDLSAPLRNVIGMTEALMRKYGTSLAPSVCERLDRIRFNVDKEMELINELLQLSRIKTLRQTFEYVHLGKLLEDIRQELGFEIDKRNIQLQIDRSMPSIYCEKNRLKQVFQNLIDNAIKYTVNSQSPTIAVQCEDLGSSYRFSVSDNGIGIHPEDREKIFYVFRRAKNEVTSHIEGRGIGLSTVKSIIENYNGDIWVESTPGQGSTFFFTLDKGCLQDLMRVN